MNKVIKDLLEKPMDRKGFLKHIGVGALFVGGGGLILNAVQLHQQGTSRPQLAASKSAYGYGASVYGGNRLQP